MAELVGGACHVCKLGDLNSIPGTHVKEDGESQVRELLSVYFPMGAEMCGHCFPHLHTVHLQKIKNQTPLLPSLLKWRAFHVCWSFLHLEIVSLYWVALHLFFWKMGTVTASSPGSVWRININTWEVTVTFTIFYLNQINVLLIILCL